MSSNVTMDTVANEQELQMLLAQQAEIQARIASLLPSSAPTSLPHRSPIHKQQQQRRREVPRSMSSGNTMARQLSSDRVEPSSQRSRSISQRSAPSMARTNSKGSTSARSGPFLQTGAIPPPLLSSARQDSAMEAWAMEDQPLSTYTFSHQSLQLPRSMSRRKSDLEQVPELENVGEDPAVFLSRQGLGPTVSLTVPSSKPDLEHVPELGNDGEDPAAFLSRTGFSPTALSLARPISIAPSTPATRRGLLTLDTQYTYNNLPTPTTPTSDMQSLTTATTLSRQNSLYTEPLVESIQMMKFNSNTSFSTDLNPTDHIYDQSTPHYASSRHIRRSSNEEQSQLLVGTGGAGHDSHFSHSFPSTEKYSHFSNSGSFGEKMEKSQSNESTSSTSSSTSTSRSKRVLAAQIELAAARPLKPKGGNEGHMMSRDNSSQSMVRLESKDGLQDKVAIPKPTYQRPKHDRVYCKLCEDHTDGFRGEHELRRHFDRQHRKMVKKFVCITPSNHDIQQVTVKPVVLLSRCKACQQKKQYGAYYNAAAHLRRAHFRPKSKGRSKSNGKLDDTQKRGGKGGGNWPTMDELKPWMLEIEVEANDFSLAPSQQQEEADISDDDNYDEAVDEPSAESLGTMSGGGFETPYLMHDSTFTSFPSPNNLYSMQNMQYLEIPSQNSIDSSMSCSQNSFDPFSSFPNDQLAFDSSSMSLPQAFEDQFIGVETVYPSY